MTYSKVVNATILFCDIKNFTTLFDNKDPVEAFTFANYVLSSLGEIILKYGGVIDKLMGDGLLAHFGVSNYCIDHALKACHCSLEFLDQIIKINTNRYYSNQIIISLVIGINTGDIVHGKIMAGYFEEISIYGDIVNTASKIENMTRFFFC